MKPAKISEFRPHKVDSIMDEIQAMQDRIMRRAYDLFLGRGGNHGKDFEDWIAAEAELASKPAIEVREKENEIVVQATLPGFEAKDIDVQVMPDQMLIRATTKHEHRRDEGTVHVCEFQTGEVFRCIPLPRAIDPDKVKAEFTNGLLKVNAALAKVQGSKKVDVATS
jgi:HSP20 family protein